MPAQLIARTAMRTAAKTVAARRPQAAHADDPATRQPRRPQRTWLTLAVLGVPMLAVLLVPVVAMSLLVTGGHPSDSAADGAAGYGTGLKAGTVPAQYVALLEQAGSLCAAAPPSIIAAQIEQESGWNSHAVSPAGAEGISQFMPGTWPSWSQPGQSPFDPAAAIPAQGRYDCALAAQMHKAQQAGKISAALSDTEMMLAAYNAGPAAVIAAHGIPDNGQTPSYVSRIIARAAYFADSTGSAVSGPLAARIVTYARREIGVPYAWAGGSFTGPTHGQCVSGPAANDCTLTGFDCSGLVLYAAYQASGGRIQLPHDADAQTRNGAHTTILARSQIQAGDLIGFTDPGASTAHHVGIYIGNNQMIDAPESGEKVRIDSLTTPYYRSQQWRVARLR